MPKLSPLFAVLLASMTLMLIGSSFAPAAEAALLQQNVLFFNPNAADNPAQGEMPIPVIGKPYSWSFCQGKVIPIKQAKQCMPSTANPANVNGGHAASYIFRVAPGQFLPKGLTLDGYTGVLYGTPQEPWPAAGIPICAQQLNDTNHCWNAMANAKPDAYRNELQRLTVNDIRPGSASHAKGIAIGTGIAAGGAAAAGAVLRNQLNGTSSGSTCGQPCSTTAPANGQGLNTWCVQSCGCAGGYNSATGRCTP